MGEAAVVLRDQVANGGNEFLGSCQVADIVNDNVAPLIQPPSVHATENVDITLEVCVGACGVIAGGKKETETGGQPLVALVPILTPLRLDVGASHRVPFGHRRPVGCVHRWEQEERRGGTIFSEELFRCGVPRSAPELAKRTNRSGLRRLARQPSLDSVACPEHPPCAGRWNVAVVAMLRKRRAVQAAERLRAANQWQDSGLVFTTELGGPVGPRDLLRVIEVAAKAAGVEDVGVHTLRHSAAVAWLESGVHIKAVADLLGHSSIAITGDVYGHTSDDTARCSRRPGDAARAVTALLLGPNLVPRCNADPSLANHR